jgi:NADH-quinone oxidoreductase subunit E
MDRIDKILDQFPHVKRDVLIPLLQEVQDEFGYLSEDALRKIGSHLGLPASKIYGLATFYNQFSFVPRGKFHIEICNGSACHLEGSREILTEIEKELGISDGQSTKDGNFSLEVLSCIGACGQSPVIAVNKKYYTGVSVKRVREIIKQYETGEDWKDE